MCVSGGSPAVRLQSNGEPERWNRIAGGKMGLKD
ncbi:hypothetical protein PDTA9759_00570 [Phytobacter diazotrophicus]|uniref:Uncharacterized protein n=1 Tax=Phytobacter diazotrophicus TaxID=395631 RepID=A0ABM7VNI7_9ENTR|nr:hypothetical protein PDTA9734_00560 [Phytobacter diazotrophicus]BEG79601.1 hypothetical protein PDTA9730_00570 [Phytobacter diazotrophicus]BEG85401.1 hypothetical protein PDTA9759_00570 [Phytobacter diazotrophicus]BEG91198.1 hypothetical protein PDTA9832_00570 [Phytobacter diazotrophicus]